MALVLGIAYSIIGLFSAMLLFPADPGSIAVAFIALLLVPALSSLLALEETKMAKEARFSVARLFWNHWDIFTIYFFLFVGVFLTFGFFCAVWPPIATSAIFGRSMQAIPGLAAGASTQTLISILAFNTKILLFCLVMSFFYGAGSVFVLVWNASSWGVVLGLAAASSATSVHPIAQFLYSLLFWAPLLVLQAGSYFFAATAGGVVSKAMIREKLFTPRFKKIIQDGIFLFIFALLFSILSAYVQVWLAPHLVALMR